MLASDRFIAMFCYFWFPNYIIGAMSYFSWIAWIKPESALLAAVSGTNTGLGLNPFPTFDWNEHPASHFAVLCDGKQLCGHALYFPDCAFTLVD
ncbi:hypothetical protein FS749_007582 [Ceratobasidium sp. UAMH 11750]|nr:hypothetical protein FS749_007582 [Ceratobasidium sp. UAMH 11750]